MRTATWRVPAFHVTAIIAVLAVCIGVFLEVGFLPFALHPTLMALGFLLFMSEGAVIYRLGSDDDDDTPKRKTHALLQGSAAVCALLGLIAILSAKIREKEELMPNTAHEFLGIFTLCLLTIQVSIGIIKYLKQTREGIHILGWHGKLGLVTYGSGILTACLGISRVFDENKPVVGGISVVIGFLAVLVYSLHWPRAWLGPGDERPATTQYIPMQLR